MATTLQLLTATQAANYLTALDLSPGTEAARTLNSLLLLPKAAFLPAVSALAQGLITFSDLRALPAMNDLLVGNLIAARLASDDAAALEWRYQTVWLPASIDLVGLRETAVGSVLTYLGARLTDAWGLVLRPRYDFLGADQTAYFTYAEAYNAYMVTANGPACAAPLLAFVAAHAAFRATFPALLQPTDAACPVLQGILALQSTAAFLEQPGGGKAPSPLLDWVANGTYRDVAPGLYDAFFRDLAYPAMAASNPQDGELSGLPAAVSLAASGDWLPVGGSTYDRDLASARMARVYLPAAYGTRVLSPTALAAERATERALVGYLDAARTAVLGFRAALGLAFPADASTVRVVPGTPVGLLLAITQP